MFSEYTYSPTLPAQLVVKARAFWPLLPGTSLSLSVVDCMPLEVQFDDVTVNLLDHCHTSSLGSSAIQNQLPNDYLHNRHKQSFGCEFRRICLLLLGFPIDY